MSDTPGQKALTAVLALLCVLFAALWWMGRTSAAAIVPTPPPPPPPPAAVAAEAPAPLEKLLSDTRPKVRQKALELLAELNPQLAGREVPRLLQTEQDPSVLLAALHAAGHLKLASAYGPVFEQLDRDDPAVRRKAAATLGQLGEALNATQRDEAAVRIGRGLKSEQDQLGGALTPTNAGALLPYLGALSQLGAPAGAPFLLEFLRCDVPLVRRLSAEALDRCAQAEHEKALMAAWRGESDAMVRAAIEKVLARPPFGYALDRERKVLVRKTEPAP